MIYKIKVDITKAIDNIGDTLEVCGYKLEIPIENDGIRDATVKINKSLIGDIVNIKIDDQYVTTVVDLNDIKITLDSLNKVSEEFEAMMAVIKEQLSTVGITGYKLTVNVS